jgi:hypothetical protein
MIIQIAVTICPSESEKVPFFKKYSLPIKIEKSVDPNINRPATP